MVGMFYGFYTHINQQQQIIDNYKQATEACNVDDFEEVCRLCYHGLGGFVLR